METNARRHVLALAGGIIAMIMLVGQNSAIAGKEISQSYAKRLVAKACQIKAESEYWGVYPNWKVKLDKTRPDANFRSLSNQGKKIGTMIAPLEYKGTVDMRSGKGVPQGLARVGINLTGANGPVPDPTFPPMGGPKSRR